jgi:hypothetical protein
MPRDRRHSKIVSHAAGRFNSVVLALTLLTVCLRGAGAASPDDASLLGDLPPPVAAERLVDPRTYPGYSRRPFAAPTWETFGNRPQLVGGRYHGVKWDITEEDLTRLVPPGEPLADRPWFVGRVYRPDLGILRANDEDFRAGLERMRDTGMYLFNIGGYGPGSPRKGSFGQALIPAERLDALRGILGERFLGFDLGEQDGRLHNVFERVQLPAPRTAVAAHRLFHDWCDRVIDDQGGRLSLLSVLWNWHHPIRDGAMTLAGAECQNKHGVANSQVQYAFLRGAGKQYGVLWFGDACIFSTFGVTGWHLEDDGTLVADPGGTSGSLLRRLFLTQWLWNSCILGFEGSTVAAVPREKRATIKLPARPSPIGMVQMGLEKLIQEGVSPGVMQTPVAILLDELSGWMPPRTNRVLFRVWNDLPYEPGDHFLDGLLSLLFPGYENCGCYMDERGMLSPTPHGDIVDCLLADASADVLTKYGLVVCSGITTAPLAVRERLDAFAEQGGTVVATGDDAGRLWPEWFPGDGVTIPAGTKIEWRNGGHQTVENDSFLLRKMAPPPGSEVLAVCEGQPTVVRVPRGKGTIVVLCAATGLGREPHPCRPGFHPMWGGENTSLDRPYPLLAHAREALDVALASQRLFTAGDGLTVTTCRLSDRTFTVGVGNPSLKSLPFTIVSHIGPIAEIAEIDVGPSIHDLPGYWPHSWGPFDPKAEPARKDLGELTGESAPHDPDRIGGGDMRIFRVTLSRSLLRPEPAAKQVAPVEGRHLWMPDLFTLRERLLSWPSFPQTFAGVAVDWKAVRDTDPDWLQKLGRWLSRHGTAMLVDARDASPAETLSIVESLASVEGRRELVHDEADPAITDRCVAAGITPRRSNEVGWFTAGGDGTIPTAAMVRVLVSDPRSWEIVSKDARSAWNGERPGPITGRQPSRAVPAAPARKGPPRLLAVHDAASPEVAVADRPGFRQTFNGLMLDAAWLLSRSDSALDRDRRWLDASRMQVVIDFSRSINGFPDLTFSPSVPHQRAESVRLLDAAVAKMKRLGVRHAVITSHKKAETVDDWDGQREGIASFLKNAADAGITVHWRPNKHRPNGSLKDSASLVEELRSSHPNLRMAACTVEQPDVRKLLETMRPGGGVELWLVAAPADTQRVGTPFLPLAKMPRDTLAAIARAAGDAAVVLDADYASWEETQADLRAIEAAVDR